MDIRDLINMVLPICLAALNFGIGLGLKWHDFLRIKDNPRPVLVGMAIQVLILPLLAIGLNAVFLVPPMLAIGVLLLASSPGGSIANFYSHLAKGDVALNVTLSALNSVWGVAFVPIMVAVSYQIYQNEAHSVPLQYDKLIQLMFLLLVPLVIGIFISERKPEWAQKNIKNVNRFGISYLVIVLILATFKEHQTIVDAFLKVGHVVVLFNLISLAIGYFVSRILKLSQAQSVSVTMEVGIHHCSIIIALALSTDLLNNLEVGMPSAVYIFVMHITAGLIVYLSRKNFYR